MDARCALIWWGPAGDQLHLEPADIAFAIIGQHPVAGYDFQGSSGFFFFYIDAAFSVVLFQICAQLPGIVLHFAFHQALIIFSYFLAIDQFQQIL